MSDKLSIRSQMQALDRKDRKFYDDLSEEEKKKFSTYLMMKYGANVDGVPELQEWYLRALNDRVNESFFDLNRHPKLQWLILTTVSPDMGNQQHYWLAPKKNENQKAVKFFTELYPHLNSDEIGILVKINDRDQIRQLARDHGWDEKRIKAEL